MNRNAPAKVFSAITISGVTQSTMNNVVGGRNNSTTVSTLQKLCDGLCGTFF